MRRCGTTDWSGRRCSGTAPTGSCRRRSPRSRTVAATPSGCPRRSPRSCAGACSDELAVSEAALRVLHPDLRTAPVGAGCAGAARRRPVARLRRLPRGPRRPHRSRPLTPGAAPAEGGSKVRHPSLLRPRPARCHWVREDPWNVSRPHAPRDSGDDWSALLTALPLVLGLLAGTAPPARSATTSGHDISWPQCPVSAGGYGLPMPPTTTSFVVVGLTKGLPFTENPCLADQVGVGAGPTAGRRRPTPWRPFPPPPSSRAYRSKGPWSASTRAGQLSNVGYVRGDVRRGEPAPDRFRAAGGVDRRRTTAGPALADRHRRAAAGEPLRRRGPDARAARRGLLLRRLLLPLGVDRRSPAPGGCPACRSGPRPAASTTRPRPWTGAGQASFSGGRCACPSGTTTPATTT